MADVKVSGLPTDSSLKATDYFPINDATGPTTKRTLLSTFAAWLFNQVNIPAGSGSPVTRFDEAFTDFVASGLIWTADAAGSTRNASMTSGTVYINGRRILLSGVAARTFLANLDTYIDVLDNLDGTGTLVYTTVANGAASPALAANSLRLGYIGVGATSIAAAANIVQWGVDSLGNFRRNNSPNSLPLTIYTNPGTMGGTFYYRTIDGVKEFWGAGANSVGAAGPATYFITLPTGFFNQINMANLTAGPNNTTNQVFALFGGGGVTTSQLAVNLWANTTTAAMPIQVFARGL